ncbi:hypothetical protein TMO_0656 [Tistrella mobilis KA081020-065]|uniref:Uncharacterized protein n=1 Tax=Tistrella mobilis (strain KA081020-065) TaxID=1110502 RepID=I3TIA7_TISMK|nr:hypothetical protein TMO_0656 [Tistrella mobilis KA081020-065]
MEWTKNAGEVQEFRGVMPVPHALHANRASVQVQHEHLPT